MLPSLALVNGTLSAWLRSINEDPLAAVADEVAADLERDADEKLRDFLYRAGVETAEDARQAHSEAQRLLQSGRPEAAALLLRRAAHLDPTQHEIESPVLESAKPETVKEAQETGLTLSRNSVDFGTLRRGQGRRVRVVLQAGGGGKLEGRVSAAPGWVRVEPPAFSAKRRQALLLTTETETVWSTPAIFQDTVTLETSAGRRDISVSVRILPSRQSWLKIAVWYWPLLVCAGLPVAASLAGRVTHPPVHGIQQPGFAAGGLLFLSAFVLALAADAAWPPRLLPLALSGLLLWRLSLMFGYGSARTHLLLLQTVTPVLVLLVLQTCAFLLDANGWGNWKIWRWLVAAVGLLIGYGLLHSG